MNVWVPALLLVAGCDSQRRFYTDEVDCTGLPPLSPERAGDPSLSETLLSDLANGTARVGLRWDDGSGDQLFLTTETTAFIVREEQPATWSIGVDLACSPDSRTQIHFASSDPTVDSLAAGDFTISAFGFDVPELEQGDDPEDKDFEGTITVTAFAGGQASGFMTGRGRAGLISFVTQESLGIEVEILALAFSDITLE